MHCEVSILLDVALTSEHVLLVKYNTACLRTYTAVLTSINLIALPSCTGFTWPTVADCPQANVNLLYYHLMTAVR